MAGVKKFDRTHVLEQAMHLFWRAGYERTSIPDLETATGLGRGSLYNAFGDKEGLFLAVLDHYEASIGKQGMTALAGSDKLAAIREMLEVIAARMSSKNHPPGCLHTNTCIDSPEAPDAIKRRIVRRFAEMETSMTDMLKDAQAQEQIHASANVQALARHIMATTQGLAVLSQINDDPTFLKDIIDQSMQIFSNNKP